jgi:alanine racemase
VTAPLDALLTIDLDALAANYHTLRRQAGAAEVAPVVKADGYGLGAAEVAARLRREGAETFFVARTREGVRLRRALGGGPTINVLDGCVHGAAPVLKAEQLTPVLNTVEQVAEWAAAGGGPAPLMIDTGLHRLGVTEAEARSLAGRDFPWVMSHLACADDPASPLNTEQRTRFTAAAALFPGARCSLAASDGLFIGPAFACDQVRTGICLYGGGPEGRPDPRIQPVAIFEAPIVQVRDLQPGDRVGYGATFTAERPMRAAVVAAGYADGILRASCPKAYASLAGHRCPVLGRISMDLTVFDVTEHPSARAGDLIELVGPNVPVDEAAVAAGTIAYELLTRLGARAERVYRGQA